MRLYVLVILMDVLKKIKEFKKTKKHDYKFMFFISLFSAVAGPLLFLLGLSMTSATNSVLIGKSEAVLTSVIAIIVLKEKISLHKILGTIVIFVGVAYIATQGFANGLVFQAGDIIIFCSALSYSIGTVLFKRYMGHVPPEIIVSLRSLYGAVVLFFLSLFFVDFSMVMSSVSVKIVLSLLGLVIFTTVAGQYLWYKALEITSATNVSLAGLSSPLIAIIYTVVLLGESLSAYQIIGGLVILFGLLLLELHFKIHRLEKNHRRHLKLKHWHS